MKKFSFLAMAALGLLFAACADKDVAAEEKGGGMLDGKAEGYFKISLNLPTAPAVSTRAWQESAEGTLADGLAKEYGVKTCVLLLFDGSDEANATLTQVINLTPNFGAVADDPNQITTKGEYVAKLDNLPTANLYALAVINGKGNIEFESATSIKLRGASTSGCKISTLQTALATSSSVSANDFIFTEGTTDYYFMTNAVLSNEPGGTIKPATAAGNQHILATVEKSFIYDTEAKAKDGQAATDIYVERGMAKVTIKSASLGVTALTPDDGVTISASFDGWCLDITNKKSYVVRQVPPGNIWDLKSFGAASVDEYRFIGENAVDKFYGTSKAGYRTYWALDPNYGDDLTFDSNKNTTNFSYATYATDKTTATGDNNPLYCLENTFDVAHQDARYTTRAIIGVKLTANQTFYIMGADRKTLYTLGAVEDKVLTSLMNTEAFSTWYATHGNGDLAATDVTITWDKPTAAGVIQVSTITIPKSKIQGATVDLVIDAEATGTFEGIISTVNAMLYNVERFVDGMAYYAIRIKHFGDDLTPWNNGEYYTGHAPAEATAQGTEESDADYSARQIASIYPDAGATESEHRQDANYLGRYGMVRNNWYELVIGDILKMGYSEPPTIPSHPDDDLEDSFIKARINILSWAKRPQNWNLTVN